MKLSKILPLVFSLTSSLLVNGQSFCSNASHSGQSVKETGNKVGSIGGIGYELWFEGGNNSATFYSDGSFSCSFQNSKDYLCRTGLSFDSTKTHSQIGHMYADFKLVKQNIHNVDYSYVGIYGWTRNPLVEFYVVDNWLSPSRPGDWVGNRKHGDFTIDGAQYTVYENTRNGPSIDGNTTFKQYFSIRKQARDCGTIDITAHFQQWEKLGMTMGKMHEAKVLGEAGSNGGGTTGTADFPYAKVYVGNKSSGGGNDAPANDTPSTNNDPPADTNTGNTGNGGNPWGNGGMTGGNGGGMPWGNGGNGGGMPWGNGGMTGGNGGGMPWGTGGNGGGMPWGNGGNGGGMPWGNGGNGGNGGGMPWGNGGNSGGNSSNKTTTKKTTTKTKTTTKSAQPTSSNNNTSSGSCSSKITSQGYKCCSKNCVVYYTDSDGNWGFENKDWCGCANTPKSCRGLNGYPCCKTMKKVVYSDESGDWSVENNDWCLI